MPQAGIKVVTGIKQSGTTVGMVVVGLIVDGKPYTPDGRPIESAWGGRLHGKQGRGR